MSVWEKLFGRSRSEVAREELLLRLKSENAQERAQAARELGDSRDTRAVDALIAALDDQNEEARLSVLKALSHILIDGKTRVARGEPPPSAAESAALRKVEQAIQEIRRELKGTEGAVPKITERDAASISCAACNAPFSWDDAYHQRNTPGAARHNPSGVGDFRPRAFCPGCGAMVAEWDIDTTGDRNRWKWHAQNARLNDGRKLPPSPLVPWGHALKSDSQAPVETPRIDVTNVKTVF